MQTDNDPEGPPVFWRAYLQAAGVDYRQTTCPQAEWRCQWSFETTFNWVTPAPEAMRALAADSNARCKLQIISMVIEVFRAFHTYSLSACPQALIGMSVEPQ